MTSLSINMPDTQTKPLFSLFLVDFSINRRDERRGGTVLYFTENTDKSEFLGVYGGRGSER